MTTNPLILTLTLNPEAQRSFNNLRQQYFPPERNFLDAHLSLFHQLPAGEEGVVKTIKSLASEQSPFNMAITEIVSIGNGVAYKVGSEQLQSLHRHLQQQWQQWIIPQDKQKLWPHITIQNKVSPDVAKALINELSTDFKPFEVLATGFSLWEYLGGPWKLVETFAFKPLP
jgi:2'-5' RNA ligase